MNETESNIIELHFPVQARKIPADHGYLLFSAISGIKPSIHAENFLGIHTMRGVRDGMGFIRLLEDSELKLRLPVDRVASIYDLAGKRLRLGSEFVLLGAPRIVTLSPASRLWARLVLIKTKDQSGTPATFLDAANRQLQELGVSGTADLEESLSYPERDKFARRVLKVRGATIAGYGMYVYNLNEVDSLRLQSVGIGGRRKMGCGLFVPVSDN